MNQASQIGKKFYDSVNFPHGFTKSGFFTIKEARLLETHGFHLKALSTGTLSPSSEEEQHFIEVCLQQALPETELERVWLKYLSYAPKTVISLSATHRKTYDVDEFDDNNDELLFN